MGDYLADAGRLTADQLAPTLCCASFDRNRHAVDCEGLEGSNNFVDPVRFTSRIDLGAVDLISEPRNRPPTNVMVRRSADDGSAVIGFIAYRDYFKRHICLLIGS